MTKSADLEFAKKCLAHAPVCWQAWVDGQDVANIIADTGIAPWSFDIDETPTFVFYMSWALSDYLLTPVSDEDTSWSDLKAMYR